MVPPPPRTLQSTAGVPSKKEPEMGELGECQLHGQWPQGTSHLLRTISHLRVTVEVKWHTHALVLCGKCHKCDVARLLRLRMDAWECMQDLA